MHPDRSEFERHILTKKRAGIPLTADERAKLDGDASIYGTDASAARQREHEDDLVAMLQSGRPMSKDAAKKARRIIRERASA
jgi:hypothetical protein